ncbi:DUF6414 family protein [Vibrio parahaemolyticus]|uniref:DUF6414 family protein n=1 Tax=Vibrio parahaemolyticus TaxID=670 RepID=UPI00235E30DE|nr:hypothetical protein [Vibrio parahaemolyticus]
MIKNFIYLDEQKLYSFSSQLFEGVTEYFLNQHAYEHEEQETQKGTIASGRAIADAVKEASSSTSKKFLHDYSFNLFESELTKNELLLDINDESVTHEQICNSGKSFIRIRSKGKFVDTKEIQELFRHFNEIGRAIASAQLTPDFQLLETLKNDKKSNKQANELQRRLEQQVRQIISESELALPKTVLDGLDTMIEQFGDELVRFQQTVGEVEFSTCMSPDSFRDPIKAICKKYARKTAKEFVVLGTICHSHDTQEVDIQGASDSDSLQKHLIGLTENLYDLEQMYASKDENEIIIEPIAVYTEL